MPVELLGVIKKELVPQDVANAESEGCATDGIAMEEAFAVTTAGEALLIASTGWPFVPLLSVMP
jgi:hypothetical protein